MVAKPFRWALAGLVACPSIALALGLGDVHLHSTLDAPLDATIDLVGATQGELASLKPQIAARELFVRNGLNWSPFLSSVKVTVGHAPDGQEVLELRSTKPVTEPFLTVLIELDWDRGRVVREYDLLFDPPVYAPQQSAAASSIAAPASGGSAREGAVERRAARAAAAPAPGSAGATTAAAPESAAPSSSQAAGASGTAAGTYQVRRGDTLSGIAEQLAGGSHERMQRWMVAAYQGNPQAFDRNMNWLRAGTVLRIPSAAALDAVTPSGAAVEIHRQYVAWRGETAAQPSAAGAPGRLRLVAPGSATASGGAAIAAEATAAGGSVKALRSEVKSLETQLSASQRLLDLRNQQLAQLQAKLAAREGEHPAAAAPSAASAGAAAPGTSASASATAAEQAPAGQPSAQPATQPAAQPATQTAEQTAAARAAAAKGHAARPAQAPAAAASAARHHPVRRPKASSSAARAATPSGSWLGAAGRLWWVVALAIIALLAYLGLRSARSRRKAGFDDSLGRLAEAGAAQPRAREPAPADPRAPARGPEPRLEPRAESSILVEETGTHEHPRFDGGPQPAPLARHVAADDGVTGEAAINLDQGDPLAEADFHMAYGLYDQAADLVRIAIEREPERRDLRLKLLEVFFVWGNKDQFLTAAHELAATRAQAAPGEWEKILIMGKQLAPEDPLFEGAGAVSGAAAGGVDLDLEGGQHRVDFDVAGASSEPSGVDLDIGTAVGERDPVAEAAAQQATDRNLALDDSLVLPEDATAERTIATVARAAGGTDGGIGATREMAGARDMTGTTREMTGSTREMTTTLDRDSWDPGKLSADAATVEQPTLQSEAYPTIRQKVEMALRAGGASHEPEHTTELAIDDLGLDLTALQERLPGEGLSDGESGSGAAAPGELGLGAAEAGEPGRGGGPHDSQEGPRSQGATELTLPELGTATDAPTLIAGLDEHSRALIARAEHRAGAAGGDELKVSETGSWHFDDDALAEARGPAETGVQVPEGMAEPGPQHGHQPERGALEAEPESGRTAGLEALQAHGRDPAQGLDFEVGGDEPAGKVGNGSGGIDLDVGAATIPDTAFAATQRLDPDELAVPDLDPVTMSEVGTKLDLARAYMDMGDPEGARNILDEVLTEGSAVQKQEAERLIASLPG